MTTALQRLQRALEGRYRIERPLGQGGTALVFAATDLRQPRTVAIKVLRPELASLLGPGRFLREIAISAQLSHPHILPLFESGEADGLPWFVMPLVEGESLRERLLTERQLPLDEALRITREVAGALGYAHAQGIIHRDIKPENILLSRGHALVADFGIARALDVAGAERLTETGLAVGTPSYMSPEQASGTEPLDARSDLYSLACVLYEMLAGTPPFSAPTAQGVLSRHLVDTPPPIRTVRNTVPEDVEAAILAALAKAKADRFATVQAFIEALEGRRPSPSQPHPALRPPRRRLTLILGTSVAVFVVAGGTALALRRRPLDPRRVLVGMMENRTDDPSVARVATDWTGAVVGGLASTGLVQAVDVRSTGADSTAARDVVRLRRIARRERAASVAWATVNRAGNSLIVEIQLTDAATGLLLRPVEPVTGSVAKSGELMGRLQQRVMAAYAAGLDPRLRDYTSVSQPASWDAYREFEAGVTGYWDSDIGTDPERSEAHLRRAIVLDPEFMQARIFLAFALAARGECTPADSIAAGFRDSGVRLLPYDRANLDLVVAYCRGDRDAYYAAAGEMLRLSPDLDEAIWARAISAHGLNRNREAVAVLERLDRGARKGIRSWYWNLRLHALHALGRYQEALQAARNARVEFPDDPLVDRYEMRQLAALGGVDSVNLILERRLRKSSLRVLAGEDLVWVGEELKAHGHLEAGEAACDRAVTWYRSRTDLGDKFSPALGPAAAAYCAERWDEAQPLYTAIAAGDTSSHELPLLRRFVRARIRLGVMAARRGDTATVARIDRWLALREDPAGWYGQAILAAWRGDPERAVVFFQRAWERGLPGAQIGHVDPDLEPLRETHEFRALLYPEGQGPFVPSR